MIKLFPPIMLSWVIMVNGTSMVISLGQTLKWKRRFTMMVSFAARCMSINGDRRCYE